MRVLVTGGTGFLGKEIVRLLVENNFEVLCLATKKSVDSFIDNQLLSFLEADISSTEQLDKINSIENIDVLIHCAGLAHQFGKINPERFYEVNVTGSKNVAEFAVKLGCERLILISSVAVYGFKKANIISPIDEETKCNPKGVYAESKYQGELICREICSENNIALTVLRPATIIGEGDRGNVYRLIKVLKKGLFIWIGKGTNYKSLIYKKDVAEACLEILKRSNENFEIYNLSAEPVTMKEIVSEISKLLNKKNSNIIIPESFLNLIFQLNKKTLKSGKIEKLFETIEKWKSDEVFSSKKIREKYGFVAKTSAKEALKKETEYFLKKECSE